MRDNNNSFEGYSEIIQDSKQTILRWEQKKVSLLKDEENGIQKYPKSNTDIIKSVDEDILSCQIKILRCSYSMGENEEVIEEELNKTIDQSELSWRKENGYVQMVWLLSIGIMLEIKDDKFKPLLKMIIDQELNDYLINFLINHRIPNWNRNSTAFEHEVPYLNIKEIVELAKQDKILSVNRLQQYLKKEWYKGHSDTGWYNSHKSKWNVHCGYWSFETGALVKILGLNDNQLEFQNYYPYDMVHWKK